MKDLGSEILARRQELGLKQQELADLAGVGINTLVSIERGKGNPSIKIMQKIADVMGLELKLWLK